jgi:hypothetical protein
MRAAFGIVALVWLGAGVFAPACAYGRDNGPRASTSAAVQGSHLALAQPLARSLRAPAPVLRGRRPTALTVTSAAVAVPAELEVTAYDRVTRVARSLLNPGFVAPPARGPHLLRSVSLAPFAPYFGCYGASVTFETDALLH